MQENFLNSAKHISGTPGAIRISQLHWQRRGANGHVYVSYRIEGDAAWHRSPRAQTKHLDSLPDAEIRKRLTKWRHRVSGTSDPTELVLPTFWTPKFETDFRQFLEETQRPATANATIRHLTKVILPWLVRNAQVNNLADFEPETRSARQRLRAKLPQLSQHIKTNLSSESYQKECRRALSSFRMFLVTRKDIHWDLASLPRAKKKYGDESAPIKLPGQSLPTRELMVDFLSGLEPSRAAYILTIIAALGVRVSEAMALEESWLMSKGEVLDGLFGRWVRDGRAFAVAAIRGASKRRDDHGDKPKRGTYQAVCLNRELAVLLLSRVVTDDEWAPFRAPAKGEYYRTTSRCRQLLLCGADPLCLYTLHNFRAWSITRAIGENPRDFYLVSRCHGHKDEQTTRGYYDEYKSVFGTESGAVKVTVF